MSYQSPLRDLIIKLDEVAQAHPAYSQAADLMRHVRDHLSALARCEEVNHQGGLHPIEPHRYQPDALAQGDCRVCGHRANKPWHLDYKPEPQSSRYKPIEPGDPPRYLR